MSYTMIMRTVNEHNISAYKSLYTLIDGNMNTVTIPGTELVKKIKAGTIEVTNMDFVNGELTGTNGVLDRYTTVTDDNKVINLANVILSRIEKNGQLVGYCMFTTDGTVKNFSLAEAIKVANAGGIANGKVRHTKDGDVISSILGNYPLLNIVETEIKKHDVAVTPIGFMCAIPKSGELEKYASVIVTCSNLLDMKKVRARIEVEMEALKDRLTKNCGYSTDEVKKLKIIVASNAGIFVPVLPISAINSLISSGVEVKKLIGDGRLVIGCSHGSAESILVLNDDFVEINHKSGDDISEKTIEKYKPWVKQWVDKYMTK